MNAMRFQQALEQEGQTFSVLKTDESRRLVFGWASVAATADGQPMEDRQHDCIDPEELEQAAYRFVLEFRTVGEEHRTDLRQKGRLVESCVFTREKQAALGLPPGLLPEGWWIGFYIDDDETWSKVRDGTYRMFSIEGNAQRVPLRGRADAIQPSPGPLEPGDSPKNPERREVWQQP